MGRPSKKEASRLSNGDANEEGANGAGVSKTACPTDIQTSKASTSIFQDGIFTFYVGPDKTRFIVHQTTLRDVSEPLTYLMTNGKMAESIQGSAELNDVDPAVFEEFLKYAYIGVSGLLTGISDSTPAITPIAEFQFACSRCNKISYTTTDSNSRYPFCSADCESGHATTAMNLSGCNMTVQCVHSDCGQTFYANANPSAVTVLCASHNNATNRAKFCDDSSQTSRTLMKTSETSISKFAQRTYGYGKFTHEKLKSLFDTLKEYSRPLTDITFHAQLYVLADKYMVNDLVHIALHKLHSNLVATKPTEDNINYLVELILYIYSNTSDGGNIIEGTCDRLRDLVMGYAIEHSRELAKHRAFQHALAAGGSHNSDFLALVLTHIAK